MPPIFSFLKCHINNDKLVFKKKILKGEPSRLKNDSGLEWSDIRKR